MLRRLLPVLLAACIVLAGATMSAPTTTVSTAAPIPIRTTSTVDPWTSTSPVLAWTAARAAAWRTEAAVETWFAAAAANTRPVPVETLTRPSSRVSGRSSTSTGSRPAPKTGGGSHRGYATAEECVSMTENGGDYGRSSNPSHFGRYQFSRGAWAAGGGNPGDWGTASPAEQDRVFGNLWNSPGGPANWLPYDGC